MPTYQYSCTECAHFFEQFQSFSDEPLTACPECQGRLRKVFNSVGVVFKGSGFYRTDSRTTPSEGGEGKSSGSGDSAPSKESAKSSGKEPAKAATSTKTTEGSAA